MRPSGGHRHSASLILHFGFPVLSITAVLIARANAPPLRIQLIDWAMPCHAMPCHATPLLYTKTQDTAEFHRFADLLFLSGSATQTSSVSRGLNPPRSGLKWLKPHGDALPYPSSLRHRDRVQLDVVGLSRLI
ncbi:hypothetical protein B0T19DRAFT_297406 [Cercophora scortea]|uniref:Uncharacterized protein n=1 Tax=Cercophora scortea TaxID=314031 RepID=A0AAE0I3M3_9PEZI|nr:hypothetical protein B0T19DRAFT_297406 [Cercophora scortea]